MMKKEERLKAIGLLVMLNHKWSHDWSDWIINLMIEELVAGNSPILENHYQNTDFHGAKSSWTKAVWDELENCAKEQKVGILAYLDQYVDSKEIRDYQSFIAATTNVVVLKLSERCWYEIKKDLKT